MHEGDEPDPVAHLRIPIFCPAKTWLQLIFRAFQQIRPITAPAGRGERRRAVAEGARERPRLLRAPADHRFNARLYFDSIADHGGPILIDRELRGWSQGLADTA